MADGNLKLKQSESGAVGAKTPPLTGSCHPAQTFHVDGRGPRGPPGEGPASKPVFFPQILYFIERIRKMKWKWVVHSHYFVKL